MTPENLPEDIEAERSLLATLWQPGAEFALATLLPRLRPADFVHPSHRTLFVALASLVARRAEVNPIVLAAELEAKGDLERLGGRPGMYEILGAMEVGNPAALVEILTAHRRRRELMVLGERITGQGADRLQDPDEVVHDAQAELARIARDGAPDGGESWMEILHQMAAFEPFRQGGSERGGWWGIPTLDQVAPIPTGEFVTVGARPGVGKTALFTQIAIESARRGIRPLAISLELPKPALKARLASHLSGIPMGNLKRGDYQSTAVTAVGEQAACLELGRLQAPVAGTPWPKIEAMIRAEIDRHGVQLVLLDQFDKIGRPEVKRGSSEAYAFGAVSTGIMGLVQELGIGFVLICQLKGDAEGREPTLADHADSDRPGKDAAVVWHMWRNKDGDLRGKLQKNRDGSHVGMRLHLDLQGHCQRILEVEEQTATEDRKTQSTGRGEL